MGIACSCCRRNNKIGPSSNLPNSVQEYERRKSFATSDKKIVLLLVGLDNAGKTTAAKNLIGEPIDSVVPTVGFSSIFLKYKRYIIMIYDLGGGSQIRNIWHRYFVDVHGIIFVVDASDDTRLDECRFVLENLLSHEKLSGKPLLLLANKQDCDGALDELDIVEKLNVEQIVNQHRCPTLVETCSATTESNSRKKKCAGIHQGYKWLLECIIKNYPSLNERVMKDMTEQKKVDDAIKKERLERIKKLREERGDSVMQNGSNLNIEEGKQSDNSINPFRPISEIVNLEKNDQTKDGLMQPDQPMSVIVQDYETPENLKTPILNGQVKEESSYVCKNDRYMEAEEEGSLAFLEVGKDASEPQELKFEKPKLFHRNNKTWPATDINDQNSPSKEENFSDSSSGGSVKLLSPKTHLPPLKEHNLSVNSVPWARPLLKPASQDSAWDLDKALEVVSSEHEESNLHN